MRALDDLFICLRFFSRLPVPTTARETALGARGLAEGIAMVPWAGALLGLCPAAILVGARAVGLAPLPASGLALTALVLLTGAMHEDALADCADGFGGGRTREQKLAIMRDSRVGAFGACAIGLSLMLRASALSAIVTWDLLHAAWVVIGAAALSRGACALPLALLAPARTDGAGAAAIVSRSRAMIAVAAGAVIVLAIGLGVGRPIAGLVAVIVGLGAALGLCRLARAQIGGQTGDVAGAVQQIVEIAVLLAFATGAVGA